MRLMRRKIVVPAVGYFWLQTMLTAAGTNIGLADDNVLPLVIKFDAEAGIDELAQVSAHANKGEVPLPLVYIQGKLAGSVPGEFAVPRTQEPIAVEIGFPQLSTTPIYSFTLTPDEFSKQQINLVKSNFKFDNKVDQNVWANVLLAPNTMDAVSLDKAKTTYEIKLPSTSYVNLAKFWLASNIEPYGPNWIDNISPKNNSSLEYDIDHVVFDLKTQKVAALHRSSYMTWAGHQVAFLPFPTPEQTWEVISIPAKADVYTDRGWRGNTTLREPMPITGSFYILVKLAGFPDCTDQNGKISQAGEVKTLTCEFK